LLLLPVTVPLLSSSFEWLPSTRISGLLLPAFLSSVSPLPSIIKVCISVTQRREPLRIAAGSRNKRASSPRSVRNVMSMPSALFGMVKEFSWVTFTSPLTVMTKLRSLTVGIDVVQRGCPGGGIRYHKVVG